MSSAAKNKSLEKAFYSVLFLLGLLFIYSCIGRSINVDDGWLGEPAMWFARDGYIHSAALRGWETAETHLFFTHKLLVMLGGFFVKLFGYSVYSLKSVSAFYLLLLAASWVYFFKKMHLTTLHSLVFLALLLVNSLVFEYAFIFRPEIALAFFASWVFYLLSREDEKDLKRSIIAGVLAAVAIGHHLNAVIIAGAGCVLLLCKKQYRNFLIFGCVAALGFGFYFLEVHSVADMKTMLAQFSNTQDMRGEKSLLTYLFNLVDEQRRYLHSPREISITLLCLVVCLLGKKIVKEKYASVAVFALSMMAFLALIAHGKTSKYLILFMPLLLFMVTAVILAKWQNFKKTILSLVVVYAVVQMSHNIEIALAKNTMDQNLDALVGDLAKGSRLVGPMEAVFWAWDKYDLQAFEVYEIYNLRGVLEYGSPDFFSRMQSLGVQGIILNPYMKETLKISSEKFGDFSKLRETGELSFYVKNQ